MKSLFISLFCSDVNIMKAVYVLKTVIMIICVIAPIILIVKSIIITYKSVLSNKNDAISANLMNLINSLISVMCVFLIPTFLNSIFSLAQGYNSAEFLKCWNVTKEDIDNQISLNKGNCSSMSGYEWDPYINECIKENTNDLSNVHRQDTGTRPNLNKVRNLNYISQGKYSYLPFCSSSNAARSGCGAASFAMISSSYSDSKYDMEYVVNWFCNNKYSLTDGALSNEAVLDPDTAKHFKLNINVIFGGNGYSGSTYNESNGQAILKAVQSGKSVMFGMPGHWAVAGPNENCTSGQVYLYDPGFPSRCGCYTPRELWDKTYNSGNHCTKEGICGWDIGIAMS